MASSDLDGLLDSALDDFDKYKPAESELPAPAPARAANNNSAEDEQTEAERRALEALAQLGRINGEDAPLDGEKSLADVIRELLIATEGEAAGTSGGAAAAARGPSPGPRPTSATPDTAKFTENLFEKLQESTRASMEGASEGDLNGLIENMMAEMMQGLGGGEGGEGGDDGMMNSVMEGLLAKDVMYPSLLEISQKYPQWMADNKSKVPAEQMELYRQQYGCIREIVAIYEKQGEETPTALIVEKMEQMQRFGAPPQDLVQGLAGDPAMAQALGKDCATM
eukprot:m.186862 g.186862  ORF g.186862 m.186862 type:complete len:281 (+) comp15415_c0_seq1:1588-2430(+)